MFCHVTTCLVDLNGTLHHDLFYTERSVRVDEEAGEGAVFVGVSSVHFATVQLYIHLVPHVQVQDDTIGGVVIVLICILSNRAGPHLRKRKKYLRGKGYFSGDFIYEQQQML